MKIKVKIYFIILIYNMLRVNDKIFIEIIDVKMFFCVLLKYVWFDLKEFYNLVNV